MDGLTALTIIFLVFAVGEIISTKTKAVLSMMLVAPIIFLVAFWLGLPRTIFDDSTLTIFYSVTVGLLLVNLGTTIKIEDLISQWKTCIISLLSTLSIALGVYFIGRLIIDRYYALVGAPIFSGGVVAYLIMSEAGQKVGMPELAAFGALILVIHGFIGFPVASFLCKSEARNLLRKFRSGKVDSDVKVKSERKLKLKIVPKIPDEYNSPYVILFKAAFVALLANYTTNLFNGKINFLIICMLFGIIFKEIGFLEEDPLHESNSYSIVMAGGLISVFTGLANTTPEIVLSMIRPLSIVTVIGVFMCAFVSILVGRIFKESWQMSFAIGITALFGFPGTLIISTEAANAVTDDEDERAFVKDRLVPRIVIGGVVSVSIVSGIMAGIMINWI
ncbi:MAG: hypothetical protein ACI4PU_09960 [Intestinibacter sp.]